MSEKYFLENTIDLGKPITSICKLKNGYIAISVFTNIIIYDLKNYEINNECPFGDGYSSQRIAGFIKCII